MLKKLQRKFVIHATSITVFLLVSIFFTISIVNYVSILNNSDAIINLIVENKLQLQPNSKSYQAKFSREIAFTTRYFTIMTDENNNIDIINIENISSVSHDEAVNYTEQVISSGSTSGTLNNFRYTKTNNKYGYTYIFLDIQEQLRSFYFSMFYSSVIFSFAVIVVFALSCIVSKNAVAPIAESHEKQKQFITDVSHEFKTPLTIIKANNEVIEMDYGENQWTNSIHTQITRLTCLVESLISLTKLDEESKNIIKTDFSLSDALLETCEEFSASIQSNGLTILSNINTNITYMGEESSIRQLFSILIENSIKYAPKNTQIKINLENGKKNIFTIENDCIGIKIGEYDSWFDRFYREDNVRNINSKGFGIGLSIAKSICNNHNAKIHAKSTNGKTVKIVVEF